MTWSWRRRRSACWHAADPEADARLVQQLRRGRPEALADLHERYSAGIYTLALGMVRHGEDAEDITHDVLIRVYERVPVDCELRLGPWIYRLAVNRCYDHLRTRGRRHWDELTHGNTPATHDPYEHAALARALVDVLTRLTPRQRAALLLKDVHGLTVQEVASVLELTVGSAEVLLARARAAFRAAYRDLRPSDEAAEAVSLGGLVAGSLLAVRPLPAWLQVPPPVVAPAAAPLAPSFIGPTLGGVGSVLSCQPLAKMAAVLLAAATVSGTGAALTSHKATPTPRPQSTAAVATAPGPAAGREASRAHVPAVPAVHTGASTGAPAPGGSPEPVAGPSASPSAGGPADGGLGIEPVPSPSCSGSLSSPEPEPSPSPSRRHRRGRLLLGELHVHAAELHDELVVLALELHHLVGVVRVLQHERAVFLGALDGLTVGLVGVGDDPFVAVLLDLEGHRLAHHRRLPGAAVRVVAAGSECDGGEHEGGCKSQDGEQGRPPRVGTTHEIPPWGAAATRCGRPVSVHFSPAGGVPCLIVGSSGPDRHLMCCSSQSHAPAIALLVDAARR